VGRSYKDLVVWQKSMELVTAIYGATRTFPKMSCSESQPSFAVRPFQFRATSPRGKADFQKRSFSFSLGSQEGR